MKQAQATLASYTADNATKLENLKNAQAKLATEKGTLATLSATATSKNAALKQAQTALAAAQEALKQAQAQLKADQDQLAAYQNAPEKLKVAKETLTKAEAELATAQANYETALTTAKDAEASDKVAQTALQTATDSLAQAKNTLAMLQAIAKAESESEAKSGNYHIVNDQVVDKNNTPVAGWTVKNGQMLDENGNVIESSFQELTTDQNTESVKSNDVATTESKHGDLANTEQVKLTSNAEPSETPSQASVLPQTGDETLGAMLISALGAMMTAGMVALGLRKRS